MADEVKFRPYKWETLEARRSGEQCVACMDAIERHIDNAQIYRGGQIHQIIEGWAKEWSARAFHLSKMVAARNQERIRNTGE